MKTQDDNSQIDNPDASDAPDAGEQKPRPRARGFAAMDPNRQRDIAREGGRAAHAKGTAHQYSSEEARAAGLKSRMNRLARKGEEQSAEPGVEPGEAEGEKA